MASNKPLGNNTSSTGGDFSVIEAESQAAGDQPRTSRIDVMTEDGPNHTDFTYDPNDPRPYKIDYPDPVTGERTQVEFASREAYEEWYSDTFEGRQAQIDRPGGGEAAKPGEIDTGTGAAADTAGPTDTESSTGSGTPGPTDTESSAGSGTPGTADTESGSPSGADQPPERSNSERLQGPRAQARAQAIAEIREAIQSGAIPSDRVAYAMERIEAVYGREALVRFGETGEVPPGMEFSHLLSASEYPEFAGQSESGVLTDARDHRIGHHGGDTSEPLHGLPRDPNWEDTWGSQEGDLSSASDRRYAGMTGDEPPESIDSQLARDYPQLFNQAAGPAGATAGGFGGPPRGPRAPARPAPVPPPDVLPPTPTTSGGNAGTAPVDANAPAASAATAEPSSQTQATLGGPERLTGDQGKYPVPDGRRVGMDKKSGTSPADKAAAHWPVGQNVPPGTAASPPRSGTPPPAGGTPAPGVEPVNPNYPNPPGTPQQLKQIQNEISQVLADRARAEQAEARMGVQVQQHQTNQGPAQEAVQGAQQALTATQAHEQDVQQRDAANKQQQEKQQQSQSTVGGYAAKAAGLAALTGPLNAFRGFTSLASHLPGDAGAVMAKMNSDGEKVAQAFAQMELKMAEQATGLPLRQQELQGDSARIKASGQQGQAATQDLQKAQEGAQTFERANKLKLQQATEAKDQAAREKGRLEAQAQVRQTRATTLAEQLQAWAQGRAGACYRGDQAAPPGAGQGRYRREGGLSGL